MLQSLMKPTPTNRSPPRSPTKRTGGAVIAELAELEGEIILKRPKNVTQFIRDWANSKLNQLSLSKNKFQDDDEHDEEEFIHKKGFRAVRRFALRANNSQFQGKLHSIRRNEKLEETKSVILIKLQSMEILKHLPSQMLWEIVEDFQEIEYSNEFRIISKNEPVTKFYIIISGTVLCKSPNKKPITLSNGNQFGIDSMFFSNPSPNEYTVQGVSRIAHLEGRRLTKCIRDTNIQKYKTIFRCIENIEYFKTLHNDEIDKIAEIAMNQPPISTEPNQHLEMDNFGSSFLIVLKGLFFSYSRRLTEQIMKDHSRESRTGDSIGTQSLRREKSNDVIVSQEYGLLIELRCSDIERSIGPLSKLERRRKTRA